jgi:hypothetical protein
MQEFSRGGGRDRPEAACPTGIGAADGFNAVQKVFTSHRGRGQWQTVKDQ